MSNLMVAGVRQIVDITASTRKMAAAAIAAELKGIEINPRPMLTNTCHSFVSPAEVIHVAQLLRIRGSREDVQDDVRFGRGVLASRCKLEATYASAWARNIRAGTHG